MGTPGDIDKTLTFRNRSQSTLPLVLPGREDPLLKTVLELLDLLGEIQRRCKSNSGPAAQQKCPQARPVSPKPTK